MTARAAGDVGAATATTSHFLLFYEVVPDYVARRAPLRDAHLRLAWDAQARGELVLGGAYADPADGAVLLFRGESAAVAERFVARDPYVQAGLVVRWTVRRWTTVVGEAAIMPVRPGTETPRARAVAAATRLSARKLLHSKWTAAVPRGREKHFLVTKVLDSEVAGGAVEFVELEAVHSKRVRRLPWRELANGATWLQGWK